MFQGGSVVHLDQVFGVITMRLAVGVSWLVLGSLIGESRYVRITMTKETSFYIMM